MLNLLRYYCIIAVITAFLASSAIAQCTGFNKDAKKTIDVSTVEVQDGNVWTAEDGTQYYTCPVMRGEGKVEEATSFSVVENKKYYHCCPSCQAPFRSEPVKWLENLTVPGNVFIVDLDGVKHFRDPVSGTEGVVDKDTRYFDHEHHRYFFISKKTMKKFKKSPQSYTQDEELQDESVKE